MNALSFLVVNGRDAQDAPLAGESFSGYFFKDADFVATPQGYAAFRAAGGQVPQAEDGCYIHALRAGEDMVFSADFCGYAKLFYIHRPGFWAVSNSLWQIAAAMRRAGLAPAPDLAQIAAAEAEGTLFPTGRGMFFGQATTFDTVVQGVRMLPHRMRLRIGPAGAAPEALPPRPITGSYAEALARALGIWQARLATLTRQGRLLSTDLTGGIDSRTVLAILLAGSGGQGLFARSNTNHRGRQDFRIAAGLAARLGLPHNAAMPRKPPAIPGGEAFAAWRDLCLGIYFPIYFPRHRVTTRILHFGGGGGGNQRNVYDRSLWARLTGIGRLERFIPARIRNLRPAAQRVPYGRALRETMAMLLAQEAGGTAGQNLATDQAVDPLILHYRAFRNRLHAGRTPQYLISINPLASSLLEDCAALAGQTRLQRAQIFHDIMESLSPGLTAWPFDARRKSPDATVRATLTRVTPAACPAGRCFAPDVKYPPRPAPQISVPPMPDRGRSALECLAQLYAQARPLAAQVLSAAYLRKADAELAHALKNKDFSSPTRSKRIGVVALFALFAETGDRQQIARDP